MDNEQPLGEVDPSLGISLWPLLDQSLVRIQGIALLPLSSSKTQYRSKASSNITVEIILNVFGSSESVQALGEYFSDNYIFLQHPIYPEAGYSYTNPHIISRRFDTITENSRAGGVPVVSTVENWTASAPIKLVDVFNNISRAAILDELCGDWRLKTKLLRFVSTAYLHHLPDGVP